MQERTYLIQSFRQERTNVMLKFLSQNQIAVEKYG